MQTKIEVQYDNPDAAEDLRDALEQRGWIVVITCDGQPERKIFIVEAWL